MEIVLVIETLVQYPFLNRKTFVNSRKCLAFPQHSRKKKENILEFAEIFPLKNGDYTGVPNVA